MLVSHFTSLEMVIPRNLKDSTGDTGVLDAVKGFSVDLCLLETIVISTILTVFSSSSF